MNSKLEETVQQIHSLFEKHRSNPYIVSKIHHMICHQLPNQLETNIQLREQTQLLNEQKTNTQDQFIRSFLNDCQYYYLSSTEKFFLYNGIHYQETDEDQVLYHILSSISQDRNPNLMSWKHKTKVSILKKIKENSLYKTIPESDTIQQVIDVLSPFFSSKPETKYFLTILGDNLMRKKKELIHFISPKMKLFLRDMNQSAVFYFNNQCTQTFKFKCHEKHDYENDCRLVKVQENIKTDRFWKDVSMILDILCVACHYSMRYSDSDQYMLTCDEEIMSHVFRLRDTTIDHMVGQFVKENLIVSESPCSSLSSSPQDNFLQDKIASLGSNISWKNMLFLWKQFLHKHNLPLNLYQPSIKAKLVSLFQKQYQDDLFVGIGSAQLPVIQQFLKFWNDTIFIDESGELEIAEISLLFRIWSKDSRKKGNLPENKIVDILSFFFPDIEVVHNKIYAQCLLWNKDQDIQTALDAIPPDISLDTVFPVDTYLFYCKHYSSVPPEKRLIVSKSYFDKYIENHRL